MVLAPYVSCIRGWSWVDGLGVGYGWPDHRLGAWWPGFARLTCLLYRMARSRRTAYLADCGEEYHQCIRAHTVAPALTEARSHPLPLAPPPRRGDGGSLDEWEILVDPYGDGLEDVCASLWMALRDLQHGMDRTQRNGLFGVGTHKVRARLLRPMRAAPALAPSLRTFLHLRTSPRTALSSELGAACYAVWGWAEGESLVGTAEHFAETAAYLVPDAGARRLTNAGRRSDVLGRRNI